MRRPRHAIGTLFLTCLLCSLSATSSLAQQAQALAKLGPLMARFNEEVKAEEFQKASNTAKVLIPIAEQAFGRNNPDVQRFGIMRGTFLRNLGKYHEAKAQLSQSHRQIRRSLGAKHSLAALALSTLGSVHSMTGELDEAGKLYEQAVAILEMAGAEADNDRIDTYANYSELLASTGDPIDARAWLDKAIVICKRKFGERHQRTAVLINNLGLQLLSLGAMDEAESTLRKSLALSIQLHGEQHSENASSQNNLGKLLLARGKYDEARKCFETGLRIGRAKLGDDHDVTLSTQSNLASLHMELGEADQALPLFQDSLEKRLRVFGDSHPLTAGTKHNLGCLLVDLKQYAKAKPLLESAATFFESKEANRRADSAGSRTFIGYAEANLGNVAGAVEQLDLSRRSANEAAWSVLPSLSNNAQQSFMKRTFDWTLYTALSLGFVFPDKQEVINQTAEWLANGKGIAAEALAAARQKETETTLPWVGLDELRNAIPEGAAWIDFARQDFIDYSATSYQERIQDPQYVAWIVPREGEVVRIELGDAAEIDELADAVRSMIAKASGTSGAITEQGELDATTQATEQLAAIGKRVWDPLQAKLPGDVKRILMSPDGALWLLPWSALPVGEDKMLIQDYAVSTFGSGRDLLRKKTAPPASKSPTAIFSNPYFDQNIREKQTAYTAVFRRSPELVLGQASRKRSLQAFDPETFRATPLPGTAMEAAAILPSMTKWLSGAKPVQYQGTYAMESIAKKLVSPKSLIFATHGFFSDDADKAFDPLKRCGLLLSGCNKTDSATLEDDGILTGAEIAEIDLKGTELVVLSACETGVGRVENGNGVAGLRRAFHMAGAEAVVSTLWQIPDIDSAKLMRDFFTELADGTPKDEALRRAKIKRIESRTDRHGAAHPFFWAGFTISGD